MGASLSAHATQKYTDPAETDDVKATRIVSLHLLSEIEDHPKMVKMNISHVLADRGRMTRNESTGGGSRITTDMIHLLPMSVVFVLATLFCERACRPRSEVCDPDVGYLMSRATTVMLLLPECGRPTCLDEFRGIALLNVLSKWYMASLMCMLDEVPFLMKWLDVPIFGVDGLGAEGLMCAIQLVFLRSSQ